MENRIDEIIFKMKDGRKIKVSEYGGSWTQYNVTQREMLDPEFLNELWSLLLEWKMIETEETEIPEWIDVGGRWYHRDTFDEEELRAMFGRD